MSIWPLPGVSGEMLHDRLHKIAVESVNVAGHGAQPPGIVVRYLTWVATSHHLLRPFMRPSDLDRLLLTPRYWATLSYAGDPKNIVGVIGDEMTVVSQELKDAADELGARLEVVRSDRQRFAETAYAVVDTNVFLQHDQTYQEIDWHELLKDTVRPMATIRLVVPILVVDELDATKRDTARSRARSTLKQFYDQFGTGVSGFRIIAQAKELRGEVTIQLLMDPADHVRRPIADDELIDRAVAWRWFVDHEVDFVTFDTATALRAVAAGLRPHRLEEPNPGPNSRKPNPPDHA